MESNWRSWGSLIRMSQPYFPWNDWPSPLASMITTRPNFWVTNLETGIPNTWVGFEVTVGTGFVVGWFIDVRPAGPLSNFPYGIDVVPDRPRRLDLIV